MNEDAFQDMRRRVEIPQDQVPTSILKLLLPVSIVTPDVLTATDLRNAIRRVLDRAQAVYSEDDTLYIDGYEMSFDFKLEGPYHTRFKIWDLTGPFNEAHFQTYRQIMIEQLNQDLDYFRWDGTPTLSEYVEQEVLKVLTYRKNIRQIYKDLEPS